jgi:hypothetical protein
MLNFQGDQAGAGRRKRSPKSAHRGQRFVNQTNKSSDVPDRVAGVASIETWNIAAIAGPCLINGEPPR